jgi:hypothetical protein
MNPNWPEWEREYNAPFYGLRPRRRMPWDWYYWPELLIAIAVIGCVLWSVFVPGWIA